MNIAVVGCDFIADSYPTPPARPFRACLPALRHARYATLSDPAVEMVLNLTNPASHYNVSKAALLANKPVYSEKPLALEMDHAVELVKLAASRHQMLASAPCRMLGETAQAIGRILCGGDMGTVRVVYAEMEDGMIHRARYKEWMTPSGVPWPYKDEFEVGCTSEWRGLSR